VDQVLVAIGEAPDPSFLPAGTQVEVAAWGGLLINPETLATGAPGIFAAGDVTYGPKSIIHAAAHGRLAARSIHAYLQGRSPSDMAELPADELQTPSTLPQGNRLTLDLRPASREVMPLRSAKEAQERTVEFALGLSEEQARREAGRCLRCDLAYLCPSVHVVGSHGPGTSKTVEGAHMRATS
jgi:NADH-quinone oxidoreductase subunit F